MRIDRNSAATENGVGGLRCRKHAASQPLTGVCPSCLRDRLLRLCPDCAHLRPCGCTSSSSSSSLSSYDLVGFGAGRGIGVNGSIGELIGSEPAFRRSRSLGFPIFRARESAAPSVNGGSFPNLPIWRRAAANWRFWKTAELKMERSISVVGGEVGVGDVRVKGWGLYFPSPMKVLRHRKAPALYRR